MFGFLGSVLVNQSTVGGIYLALVILSAHIERLCVSRIQEFLLIFLGLFWYWCYYQRMSRDSVSPIRAYQNVGSRIQVKTKANSNKKATIVSQESGNFSFQGMKSMHN